MRDCSLLKRVQRAKLTLNSTSKVLYLALDQVVFLVPSKPYSLTHNQISIVPSECINPATAHPLVSLPSYHFTSQSPSNVPQCQVLHLSREILCPYITPGSRCKLLTSKLEIVIQGKRSQSEKSVQPPLLDASAKSPSSDTDHGNKKA